MAGNRGQNCCNQLSSNCFPVSHWMMQSLRYSADSLSQFPDSKHIFLKDGAFYDWNEIFRQPDLARTLERIAQQGAKDFYEGETARILAREMQKNGGLITLEDLREYQAVERRPLEGDYKAYHVITSPLPTPGVVAILQIHAMSDDTAHEQTAPSPPTTH